ncbi:MAG: hypothetical protein EBU21_17225, partial [Proteobacteria bacterium]|nr:hypothetical protein [Pseudomonadota bacterium]
PNDTRFASQWGLVNSGAKSSWPVAGAVNAGTPVTVAVIDTGVQLDHPDLVNRLAPTSTWGKCLSACTAYSASNSSTFPSDGDGHGTHVAGIIAAETDNGIGVAGVAGDRPVLIMPVQVLDSDGNGSSVSVAAGVAWAVTKGAKVINLSLGSPDPDQANVLAAIVKAHEKGVLVVVSAGNCGGNSYSLNGCSSVNQKDYPAGFADVGSSGDGKLIPVAAVDSENKVASYSTQQTYVKTNGMAAPGSSILSTYLSSKGDVPGYGYESGTSMAAPHVAGAAAVIWSTFPSLTLEKVRNALLDSTWKPEGVSDLAYGRGMLTVTGALSLAQIACACAPTPPLFSPTTTRTPSVTPTRTHTPTVTTTRTLTVTPTVTTTRTVTVTPTVTTTRTVTVTPTVTTTRT